MVSEFRCLEAKNYRLLVWEAPSLNRVIPDKTHQAQTSQRMQMEEGGEQDSSPTSFLRHHPKGTGQKKKKNQDSASQTPGNLP